MRELVSKMTLEEKASLCSGKDFWHTKGIERLGIPSVMVSDGPHGLRKQEDAADHLGVNESIKAVCFPAGCAIAASFSRDTARLLGETLGNECQAENISTILGPAMNIKRSPLCGRNFEYYSEDPLVSTELGAAYVQGVQSRNVGTSPKHFMANNQEFHRMTSDSVMDERTMREIYLASFEGMVKKAKPWTIMNAYNKLNGTYLCEHKEILTEILRKEWGFDGYVMTDWGAMNERVRALKAGCNLEMPASGGIADAEIVEAVKNGALEEEILDRACEELLDIVFRYVDNRDKTAVFSLEKDHETARAIEEDCMVLLKNEDQVLPLRSGHKTAFIGKYAKKPRYQGGGSSHINSFRVDSALEAVSASEPVIYAKGYEDVEDAVDEALVAEAVEAAKNAETAVVFAGLPDNFESEGYDRRHLRLPDCQNQLIEKIATVQPNTVVVLHNGAPVEMPWIDRVKAVLEVYLGGQAVGSATANVLYGRTNPSGRLPETFPLRLEDTPCYLFYGGENDKSEYREGVFVGYRYYTSKQMSVLFSFGHGLSYTDFAYSNLIISSRNLSESVGLTVKVDVTNTGQMTGKEVIQLYVSPKESSVIRPVRELRAFDKIELLPGETRTVTFELDSRAFSYWNTTLHDWYVETGRYEIQIGKSASVILMAEEVTVSGEKTVPRQFTLNSTLGEILSDARGQQVLGQMLGYASGPELETPEMAAVTAGTEDGGGVLNQEMMKAMMEGMPLRQMLSFIPGTDKKKLEELVSVLNT